MASSASHEAPANDRVLYSFWMKRLLRCARRLGASGEIPVAAVMLDAGRHSIRAFVGDVTVAAQIENRADTELAESVRFGVGEPSQMAGTKQSARADGAIGDGQAAEFPEVTDRFHGGSHLTKRSARPAHKAIDFDESGNSAMPQPRVRRT